eukprot:6462771-Amphidinium_carterae.1
MPLEDDPIEDFSPTETPGMASTDPLQAVATEANRVLDTAGEVVSDVVHPTAADTIVNTSSSSSSSTSSSLCNRQTGGWPEMGEEEEVSSGNVTVSSFSTICYNAQPHTPSSVEQEGSHTAVAAERTPSMSCVVP